MGAGQFTIFVKKREKNVEKCERMWYIWGTKNSEKMVMGMKAHKTLAWLTVLFFILTVVTGYEKK